MPLSKPQIQFRDIGLTDYKQCWELQEQLMQEVIAIKLKNRVAAEGEKIAPIHYLLFCEHPHVYTLGKSGSEKNLLISDDELKKIQATFYNINRGGDITYHGPGQIVGYPIFDLDYFFNDVHKYMRYLEEAIILTLANYQIYGERIDGVTGVWIDAGKPSARKICAMGVRLSRWVTMHGFALNVNTDLNYFNKIIPCGIPDKTVTSLEAELNRKVNLEEVKVLLKNSFEDVFDCKIN